MVISKLSETHEAYARGFRYVIINDPDEGVDEGPSVGLVYATEAEAQRTLDSIEALRQYALTRQVVVRDADEMMSKDSMSEFLAQARRLYDGKRVREMSDEN